MPDPEPSNPAHIVWVELKTRISTHRIHFRSEQEEAALESLTSLFDRVRVLMVEHPGESDFIELAESLLNQTLRPCTARWQGWLKDGRFPNEQVRRSFRAQLRDLQPILLGYEKAFEALKDGQRPDPDWTKPPLSPLVLKLLKSQCGGQQMASLGADLEAGIQRRVWVRIWKQASSDRWRFGKSLRINCSQSRRSTGPKRIRSGSGAGSFNSPTRASRATLSEMRRD